VGALEAKTGATTAVAQTLANAVGAKLAATDTRLAGLTEEEIVAGFIKAAENFAGGSLEQNLTTIELTGLALFQVPVSYGHKFYLGGFGELGLGATIKVMQGAVYWQETTLVSGFKQRGSSSFVSLAKDNRVDSTTFGVDLGALWRYEEIPALGPINVGFVAKNINSPKFEGPEVTTPSGVTMNSSQTSVTIKPQARLGIALDPTEWLTIVADMDVTRNSTIRPTTDSQNLGGGVEFHWQYWAMRLGAYKNVADTSRNGILTAGMSFGPQWCRFDIDLAAATDTGVYDGTTYPREAKVEFGLSTAF
jgi:hypothetical protein